jgi:hypothetical protein
MLAVILMLLGMLLLKVQMLLRVLLKLLSKDCLTYGLT